MPRPKPRTTVNDLLIYLSILLVFCLLRMGSLFAHVVLLFSLAYLALAVAKYYKDHNNQKAAGKTTALILACAATAVTLAAIWHMISIPEKP
jgi:thiamine transporter ThiT